MPLHVNTPLIRSSFLSTDDRNVWMKMDALQPAGSFKNRGIGAACELYVSGGAEKLVSSSGGNAGIATAYAGQQLGVPVTVVVPDNATETAKGAIRRFGGEVITEGSTWMEAHTRAQDLASGNAKLIHPFDDPNLWPGHATIIDEVVAAGCVPDAVVLSVGGGGLLCGVAQGLERNGLENVPILAVETHGAASLNGAMAAGKPIMLDAIETVANTLGAKQVSDAAFQVTKNFNVFSHLVSDRQAVEACWQFLDQQRVLVEPACGAALAALYELADPLVDKQNVLVIVCGGMGVTMAQMESWRSATSAVQGI